MAVTLIGCYFSCPFKDVIYMKSDDSMMTDYVDCHENANIENLNTIEQLDLGQCKGKVTAAPLMPTYVFTDSKYFSKSCQFSETKEFSETIEFSKTIEFSETKEFSENHRIFRVTFSSTKGFSETNGFSKSHFSPSDEHAASSEFKKSKTFSQTKEFTKSNFFTKTNDFSSTASFSRSSELKTPSKTNDFSFSNSFTKSDLPFVGPGADANDSGKPSAGVVAGIVCGAVAAAAIIGIAAFFIIKRARKPIIEEEIETIDEKGGKLNSVNPLYEKDAEDDPFKDDFV